MRLSDSDSEYVGRFAPSPTGLLHFGSLIAAVASFLQAKTNHGEWLVRIEDIDPPREVPGSAESILAELGRFGMQPDRAVLYQGKRSAAYRQARDALIDRGAAFWCGCSRSELPASGIYPGTCRNGLPEGKAPRSVRLKVGTHTVRFVDRVQGPFEENLQETVGDFVIQRADGLPAYQLAVVVDDAYQGVTEVVRGTDLLGSTARQIHLQRCLSLPTPAYAHHPVASTGDGQKLSKRSGADPISVKSPAVALSMALKFLGQCCPDDLTLEELWIWSIENWKLSKVPAFPRYNVNSYLRAKK
jgi:glutamyl-Q tRNA(Asp) synthetase